MNFLEINNVSHDAGKYFIPSLSVKNIGVWREYKNQFVMSEIKKNLNKYCYDD